MPEKDSGLYAAFKAKDARFDGRFFVGISSTGIYCRPICRAKQPKRENCTFYETAAEAELAGYRPCLLCRPELAPGVSAADAPENLARRAAKMLEENFAGELSLPELAQRLSCTDRHLRRVFQGEYRVSPIQYLQTCRLLLAKNLLTDTDLPILDVAMAAGFGSLRRFNDLFRSHYRLSPTALRKQAPRKDKGGAITLALSYRPPYRWEELLRFLARRAITGVETVENGTYARTVRMAAADGKIAFGSIFVSNRMEKNRLAVTISESLLPVVPQVLSRVKHLFDLYADPVTIHESLSSMNELRPGICTPGLRLPGCFDAFEMAVRAVLGQQITVKAAGTLAARIVEALGTPFQTGHPGLTHAFPAPEEMLAAGNPLSDRLGPLGVTSARASTISELARAFTKGAIDFGLCAQPESEIKKLLMIRGIGNWTAHYIAMRAMGWPDAFLETDAGVKKALGPRTSGEMLALAEAWRPWRSYATINLWNALENR